MSDHGPKQFKLYNQTDNLERKSNNTGDRVENVGPHKNVKSYSTKPGQLSIREQTKLLADKYKKLSQRQPVIALSDCKTEEERQEFLRIRGLLIETLKVEQASVFETEPLTDETKSTPSPIQKSIIRSQIELLEERGFNPEQIIAILKMG